MYRVFLVVNGLNVSEKFDSDCEFSISDGVLIVPRERKVIAKFAAFVWQYYKFVNIEENA